MSQSVIIFGVLLFLFVVYVTSKGQLPAYLAVFGLKSQSSTAGSAGNGLITTPQAITPLPNLTPVPTFNTANISTALPTLNLGN